jgi:simple sugar transport system permease protein
VLLVVSAGLIVAAAVMLLLGYDAPAAYRQMLLGAFGGRRFANLLTTLNRATPIIGMGLAAALAFRAGCFNIGGEGQMIIGALTAAVLALYLPQLQLPGTLVIILSILGAALSGGIYALLAAVLQLQLQIPLLISTLLLNYPARYCASYLVSRPLRDIPSGMNQTLMIDENTRLPLLLEHGQLHLGVPLMVLLALFCGVLIQRSVAGYEWRMHGYNPRFARYAGIRAGRLGYQVMFSSGAIAGLTGAIEVLGVHYRYIDDMLVQPLYAWTGIMAALLAGNSAYGVILSGLFFAALQTGGGAMERRAGVPRELAQVLQALIIMLLALRSRRPGQERE